MLGEQPVPETVHMERKTASAGLDTHRCRHTHPRLQVLARSRCVLHPLHLWLCLKL